jgi:hypothetical protein
VSRRPRAPPEALATVFLFAYDRSRRSLAAEMTTSYSEEMAAFFISTEGGWEASQKRDLGVLETGKERCDGGACGVRCLTHWRDKLSDRFVLKWVRRLEEQDFSRL